jgi:hypothetical protein
MTWTPPTAPAIPGSPTTTPLGLSSPPHSAFHTAVKTAVDNYNAMLGANPPGSAADLTARLIAIEAAIGGSGTVWLNGSGAPSSGTGADGNYYLDTTGNVLYGPKSSGSWPTGIPLGGGSSGKIEHTVASDTALETITLAGTPKKIRITFDIRNAVASSWYLLLQVNSTIAGISQQNLATGNTFSNVSLAIPALAYVVTSKNTGGFGVIELNTTETIFNTNSATNVDDSNYYDSSFSGHVSQNASITSITFATNTSVAGIGAGSNITIEVLA